MSFLSLIVRISGDNSGFRNALKEGEVAVAGFGRRLAGVLAGAFSIGAITAATRKLIDYASSIDDAAKRLDIARGALQEFDYWAKQNGASLDDVITGLSMLSKARLSALSGDKKTLSAFGALGIGEDELRANTLEQTFRRIAEAIRTIDFGASQEGLLKLLLGRGAGNLGSAMRESLADSSAEAQRLGAILDDNVVGQLDDAGDAIDKINAALRGPLATGLMFIAKIVEKIVNAMNVSVGAVGAFLGSFIENTKDFFTGREPGAKANTGFIMQQAWQAAVAHVMETIAAGDAPPEVKARVERVRKVFDELEPGGSTGRGRGGGGRLPGTSDAFSRQGIFFGTGQDPLVNMQREANKYLMEISRNTRPGVQRDINAIFK